ncbi:iron complex transport system substrate-binding protein [Marininema mesophilum]|uniref:Iron complex transport system substrate-binding protein n=1 Tax=Marininema mesophilum TaxID=1048340 RepID=A0A1H2ZX70_9BACL|nr:cobalamin-binding protein [Marininema mesophilum]SDX21474.1 iron complex transport system substrate-binding protein [Marininema mesophilum]
MQRIVSICPSNTEILHALGLSDQIVGIDNYSDWPGSIQNLPRLGPDLDINIEKVISLKPDWVLASLSVPGMEKNIDRLEKAGIPYLVLYPDRIEGIPSDIIKVGRKAGIETHAQKVAQAFVDQLDEIKEQIPKNRPTPRLYWEWWPKPVFTPGKDNWLTDVSSIVGGVNVFGQEGGQSVKTNWQDVAAHRPDYTLVAWTGVPIHRVKKHLILERSEWKSLPFAQEDRVYILEEGWYCRPSQRILTGIRHLAHILYPDLFSPVDPDLPLL